MSKKKAPSKSAVLRNLVMHNFDKEAPEIVKLWSKKKLGTKINEQAVHLAKSQIRKRYGKELPYFQGKLNNTGLALMALKNKPKMDNDQLVAYLATDLVDISPSSVRDARKKFGQIPEEDLTSPDPNQNSGPRSGKKKKGRKSKPKKDAEETTDIFLEMEKTLDGLIATSEEMNNKKLSEILRQGRRLVGAKLV